MVLLGLEFFNLRIGVGERGPRRNDIRSRPLSFALRRSNETFHNRLSNPLVISLPVDFLLSRAA